MRSREVAGCVTVSCLLDHMYQATLTFYWLRIFVNERFVCMFYALIIISICLFSDLVMFMMYVHILIKMLLNSMFQNKVEEAEKSKKKCGQ